MATNKLSSIVERISVESEKLKREGNFFTALKRKTLLQRRCDDGGGLLLTTYCPLYLPPCRWTKSLFETFY